jgi:hypothetical protein
VWRSVLTDKVDFNMPWWEGISDEGKDFVHSLLDRCATPSSCRHSQLSYLPAAASMSMCCCSGAPDTAAISHLAVLPFVRSQKIIIFVACAMPMW